MSLKITLSYIHVPNDAPHVAMAQKFVSSYHQFPPQYPHSTVIICQGHGATPDMVRLFSTLPNVTYYVHDDSGWDIGGFIAAAKWLVAGAACPDILISCGGSTFFRRAGWLNRIASVWGRLGPGVYGASATYEVSPHLNTSGFWCPPQWLAEYPIKVTTKEQRYDFEHGPNAFWKKCFAAGRNVQLVTWDGEYGWKRWRVPRNIFRSGDQSNILMYWHHHENYERESVATRAVMKRHTDSLTDPLWGPLYRGQVNAANRARLEAESAARFRAIHKFDQPTPAPPPPLPARKPAVYKPAPRNKTITIVGVTSLAPRSHVMAMINTQDCIPHKSKLLLIAPTAPEEFDGIGEHRIISEWMPGGKWSIEGMGNFLLHGLVDHIDTDIAIVVHWDGFAVNKDRWSDEFLQYDYIGAPWPKSGHMAAMPPHLKRGRVGNGGFSIRSKRWLQACAPLPKSKINEDVYASCINREHFERAGCIIAPLDVAMRWSVEHRIEEYPNWKLTDSFGFHGLTETPERAHLRLNPNE